MQMLCAFRCLVSIFENGLRFRILAMCHWQSHWVSYGYLLVVILILSISVSQVYLELIARLATLNFDTRVLINGSQIGVFFSI